MAAPSARQVPALILAAGRGERMRPLTDTTPKPLLPVRGKPLIVWHLEALARDGVREVVINTAWLEEQFPATLGDGSRWDLKIRYSMEGRDHGGALETAGGIAKAQALLQSETFWALGGDAYVPGFHFDASHVTAFTATRDRGHLWMVPNPPQHPRGDFVLDAEGRLHVDDAAPVASRYTYSTIALFNASLVESVRPGEKSPLLPHLKAAIAQGRLGGSLYTGFWADVGTPQRWEELQGEG